jgi:hypothetical protein
MNDSFVSQGNPACKLHCSEWTPNPFEWINLTPEAQAPEIWVPQVSFLRPGKATHRKCAAVSDLQFV